MATEESKSKENVTSSEKSKTGKKENILSMPGVFPSIPSNPTILDIQESAQILADVHHAVVSTTKRMELEIESAVQPIIEHYRKQLDPLIADEISHSSTLEGMLKNVPDLFMKPRSILIDGVTCGFRKATDTLTWEDDGTVIDRIRSKSGLPDLESVLVRTTESINIGGLENLDDASLKRIGVTRILGMDLPFIAIGDSDIRLRPPIT